MTFTLQVDAVRWRDHLNRAIGTRRDALQWPELGDVIGVVKGNGYGFTAPLLAREATRAGLRTLAVGTIHEAAEVLDHFDGDVLVLQPFDPRDAGALDVWTAVSSRTDASRVVRTIASHEAAHAVAGTETRVVIELLTSVRRFGVTPDQLASLLKTLGTSVSVEGVALHLPLTEPDGGAVAEVVELAARWLLALDEAGVPIDHPSHRVLVSHLDLDQLRQLRAAMPDVAFYPRVGTDLWLGNSSTLRVTGTVLAVHDPSDKGVGYRQRKGPRGARLVVISGGTSHGVALAAPSANASLRQRAITASTGLLDAAGRSTSPFTIDGQQRMFAEPPHMHVSLVWLHADITAPNVGDEIECRVRNTTARFDRVVGLD